MLQLRSNSSSIRLLRGWFLLCTWLHMWQPEAAATDCREDTQKPLKKPTEREAWGVIMPQDRGGQNRKVCGYDLSRHPPLKAFPASHIPAGAASPCRRVLKGFFFLSVPPFLHCPSPLVFMEIWLPNPFQIHIINSTRLLMWGHIFAKGEKCRIQNLACHMQRPLGRQTKDSLYVFLFFNRQKVTASSSH